MRRVGLWRSGVVQHELSELTFFMSNTCDRPVEGLGSQARQEAVRRVRVRRAAKEEGALCCTARTGSCISSWRVLSGEALAEPPFDFRSCDTSLQAMQLLQRLSPTARATRLPLSVRLAGLLSNGPARHRDLVDLPRDAHELAAATWALSRSAAAGCVVASRVNAGREVGTLSAGSLSKQMHIFSGPHASGADCPAKRG